MFWDYHTSSNHLTILYPDGMTSITTRNRKVIAEFLLKIGDGMHEESNDWYMDDLISSFAHRLDTDARTIIKIKEGQ